MNSVDKFFQQSHYNIIRVLLSASGLWPYHTANRRRAIYFGLLLVLGSGLTFEVLGMFEVWPDSFEVVDCLPLLVLGVVSMVKLVCAVYTLPEVHWTGIGTFTSGLDENNRTTRDRTQIDFELQIRILLIKMRDYCLSPKSNEETNILHSYALYGRNLGYAYTGVLLSHTVVFVFATLLTKLLDTETGGNNSSNLAHNSQTGLFYHVNYMVDVETYYVPIFIHSATCVVLYTLLMITFDVLYLTLVQHCCGLFAALRYRLESAVEFENYNGDLAPMSRQQNIRLNILYGIQRHAEAIQFVIIMESMYRIPLFVHVGANISVLSILGFQVITNTEDINRIFKYASYLSALLVNTFFENWQGQKIIDSSEKVFESAYNSEWYKMPTEQRKLLIMIMMRSKRPFQMTAGNFVVLSYVNFNAVLRASSSYFMLLQSMQ